MNSIEELQGYKELLDEGIITQSDFDKKKKEILSSDIDYPGPNKNGNGILENVKQKQDELEKSDHIKALNQLTGFIEPRDQVSPKSKVAAAWLSIIPGMGVAYLENYKFAVILWIWWAISLFTGGVLFSMLGGVDIFLLVIFGFGKQGALGGIYDRMLVDGQGRKLVPSSERPSK